MKKIKNKNFSSKLIAYTALFTALSVTLNAITLPFAVLGTAISFTYIPSLLAGALLGPIPGMLVGLIGDGLGVIIAPKGPWIPLITIGSGMIGLIPGLVFKIKKIPHVLLIAISLLLVYLITSVTLNTLGLYLIYAQGKKTFWIYLTGRLPMQTLVFAINIPIIYVLYETLINTTFKNKKKSTETLTAETSANNLVEMEETKNFEN